MTTDGSLKKIIEKYSDLFSDKTGKYKREEISLKLKPESRPIYQKHRTVPLAYGSGMEEELKRLEEEEIISPIITERIHRKMKAQAGLKHRRYSKGYT
jgi:hypothetical protein